MKKILSQPLPFLFLLFLLIFLGLGGLGGGFAMLADPSGTDMGLPRDLLDGLPISDFVLPGVFLISVMGICPLVIAFGMWKRAAWAWWAVLAQGILLTLWICLQILLWGAPDPIQIVYLVWGLLLVAVCFLPQVRR